MLIARMPGKQATIQEALSIGHDNFKARMHNKPLFFAMERQALVCGMILTVG
jgi:hypothetical protein